MFRKLFIVFSILIIISGLAIFGYGAGDKMDKTVKAPPREDVPATKEDIAKQIKDELDSEDELLNFIPEIKKVKDEDGKESYIYKGLKLEDLDMETLEGLLIRVNNQALVIRTDRINRQLETIRQTQNVQRTMMVPRQVPTPPPTALTQPPQVPSTPPKSPQPPPAPARR